MNLNKYTIITSIILLFLLFAVSPIRPSLISIVSILLTILAINAIEKRKIKTDKKSLGIIYVLVMLVIMIIGAINYYIILDEYPYYYLGIDLTNLYWIIGIFSFLTGYLLLNKKLKNSNQNTSYFQINFKIFVWTLFILGLIGTYWSITSIGYIPVFRGEMERYFDEIGTISSRFWQINVLSSIVSFFYFLQRKHRGYLILSLISIVQLTLLNVRTFALIAISGIFLIYFYYEHFSKKKLAVAIFLIFIALSFNFLYKAYRASPENTISLLTGSKFQLIRDEFFIGTFNEYRQLNGLISQYNDDYLYGYTFLNIPLSFFPYQFWEVFNISKEKIQESNSALITQKYIQTTSAARVGILGEFYINFGFFGSLFMFFLGIIISFIETKLKHWGRNDIRTPFLFLFLAITLYALLGQINAISSILAFNIQIFIITIIFSKRIRID